MSNFSSLINQEKPVLVDFFAEWCGPCKMMSPILKEVKDELGEKVSIIKIDVDKNQNLASQFQVRGVPTLVLYNKGQQVWRQSGMVQKRELVSIINKFS
ncbi:thioredoxin [Polaribacter gangjinensis]|uniref:Thioredoxin n=1 Tax=Polaribacter gangjinensis TaxID=574710 RepID=A0A2S7WCE7_9FLAO|nr:thioredoxin [Polaribacter gangjinensis]PQJ75257.1 thioredoxin [Polaribacter gangjinensis]